LVLVRVGAQGEVAPISDSVVILDFVGPNIPLIPRKDDGRRDIRLQGESLE